jgi:hypothetical protein
VGGRRGEIIYWYPFTNPTNTVLGNLLIFISCTLTTSKPRRNNGYILTDILRVYTGKTRADSKNDICSSRILFLPKSKRFPNNSFYAISLHRTTNLSMNTYSESAYAGLISLTDQCEALTVQTLSLAVNFLKLPPFPQQGAFQKSLVCQD